LAASGESAKPSSAASAAGGARTLPGFYQTSSSPIAIRPWLVTVDLVAAAATEAGDGRRTRYLAGETEGRKGSQPFSRDGLNPGDHLT